MDKNILHQVVYTYYIRTEIDLELNRDGRPCRAIIINNGLEMVTLLTGSITVHKIYYYFTNLYCVQG